MNNGLNQTIYLENAKSIKLANGCINITRDNELIEISLVNVNTIYIVSSSCTISASLILEIVKMKIHLIFLDEKHNPKIILLPIYNTFNSSETINKQIS